MYVVKVCKWKVMCRFIAALTLIVIHSIHFIMNLAFHKRFYYLGFDFILSVYCFGLTNPVVRWGCKIFLVDVIVEYYCLLS